MIKRDVGAVIDEGIDNGNFKRPSTEVNIKLTDDRPKDIKELFNGANDEMNFNKYVDDIGMLADNCIDILNSVDNFDMGLARYMKLSSYMSMIQDRVKLANRSCSYGIGFDKVKPDEYLVKYIEVILKNLEELNKRLGQCVFKDIAVFSADQAYVLIKDMKDIFKLVKEEINVFKDTDMSKWNVK